MDHLTDEELANWYKEQMKKVTERTEERMREAKRTIPENKLNNELQKIREEGTKEIDRLSLEFQNMLLNPEHKTRCHINCYHCGDRQAQLKCADCDSQIFRFCSQQCGLDAHDEHSLLCYNRFNPEHLEEHLFNAIEEMQDPQEIDDAMDVLIELEDQDPATMREAHEIIQGHLEFVGMSLIEKKSSTAEGVSKGKQALTAEQKAERARRRKERARKQRLRQQKGVMPKAQRKRNRQMRRAARNKKRAQELLTKGDKEEAAAEKTMRDAKARSAALEQEGKKELRQQKRMEDAEKKRQQFREDAKKDFTDMGDL